MASGHENKHYFSQWQYVDKRIQELRAKLEMSQHARAALEAMLAAGETEIVQQATLHTLREGERETRAQLADATREMMVLTALCTADPDGDLVPKSGSAAIEAVVRAAFVSGPVRLPAVVEMARRATAEVEAGYDKHGDARYAAEAKRWLRMNAILTLLASEREGTSYFAQVEPWVASVVNPLLMQSGEASPVPAQLGAGGEGAGAGGGLM